MWELFNVKINGSVPGSIVFDGGKIFGVYPESQVPPTCTDRVDGQGDEAHPAFIDPHVHDRYDEVDKEDPAHLETACIEGGVGTIMCMPNGKDRPFVHPDMLEELAGRWRNSKLTVRYHIAVSRNNMDVIAGLRGCAHPMLGEVKEYDASTSNPTTLIDDLPTQRKAAEAIGKGGKIRLVHAELEEGLKRSRQEIEAQRTLRIADHCQLRPGWTEVEGIRNGIWVCKDTHTPTHICHVSTSEGMELIVDAQDAGLPITFETCPHYMWMSENHLQTLAGQAKMNPALRSEEERRQVEEYIYRGYPNMIATDHAPHKKTTDQNAKYDNCPSGVPGVQTMGLIMYDLKHRNKITSQQFQNLTSYHAAMTFGFNKGEIRQGRDADVVLIDPNQRTMFLNSDMKSKCGWTPFHGVEVAGRIRILILNGNIVKQEA